MLFPDLYSAIRAHRSLVLLGTLLCVLAAFLVTSGQQKHYEASAIVRIEPVDDNDGANEQYEASQRLARTYAEMYQRGAVDQRVRTLLSEARAIGEDELVAQQVKDLDLLSVGALTTDPQRSVRIANVGWRALEALSTKDRLVLVTPAVLPDGAASPNLPLNLALALFGGLILSVALALILHAVRQPIPDADSIERDFGQPVLATVPHLRFARSAGAEGSRAGDGVRALGSRALPTGGPVNGDGGQASPPSLVGSTESRRQSRSRNA